MPDQIKLTAMDYTRAAIANAISERMTLEDIRRAAEHAASAAAFDHAVNLLAQTQ